ncbi:MAG: electron transfer flavoprotein subunit alpha/FixB family protein [Kyrpidia sp.]|nr:electron transfer flavoprotein subunit alpha/FixB family protein [Kyrpidia sp.]
MARKLLVIADLRNGRVRNVTHEALAAARRLAGGGEVAAALVGDGVAGQAEGLGAHGADKVYVVEGAELAQYTPDAYSAVVERLIRSADPDVVFFAHSAVGRDLAPKLAARFGAGQVSDVVDVADDGGELVFTRPIYAGKAFTRVKIPEGKVFATIRPNNLPAGEPDSGHTAVVETVPVPLSGEALRTVVKDVVQKATSGVDLTEAKIIVSGGRGVKSAEGFKPLYELAEVLGAAVGASRAACDAGYCDYSMQIGQTGKVVTPDLYIACGISGAIQHLAGMSNSKVIVAINKDPEAPIFKVANYGIVGDLFEVVPMLTEELKKVLAE